MRPRPLVDLAVPEPPEQVLAAFRACLETGHCTVEGHVGQREMSIVLDGESRHAFSPWLSVEAYPWQGGTRLRGRFGPHPNLWTLFVFVYSTWVAVFLVGAVLGYVQLVMATPAWGLLLAGLAAGGQAIACSVDLLGRRWGRSQMGTIRAFLLERLPHATEVPRGAPLPHELGDEVPVHP
jgi:hypothetical protein